MRRITWPPGMVAAVAVAGLALIAAYLATLTWTMANTEYAVWGPLVIAPVLIALTVPIAKHVASMEGDPWLVRIILIALVVKLLASLARYWVAADLYGGSADAGRYISRGIEHADEFRSGNFGVIWEITGGGDGTRFLMRFCVGVMALIGPTPIGAFLVFSWFSFWGLYFFYRAFRVGVPHGDHRRYALLVFFLPSMLFWPSSVGKEAWMIFWLGLGAYGGARILARLRGGYLLLALGLLGSAAVRPHMTALLAAGFTAGYLLRRSGRQTTFGPFTRLAGSAVVLVMLLLSIQAAQERFNVEGRDPLSAAEAVIDNTGERTSKGGSEYDADRPDSIVDVPLAAFTVMFRPLPHEAHNMQALLVSLEGLFLMGLFIVSRRRLRQLPGEIWRTPYVGMAAAYSFLFMMAFSTFGNFGLLARQRAQLFPFVLVILALPYIKPALMPGIDQQKQTVAR